MPVGVSAISLTKVARQGLERVCACDFRDAVPQIEAGPDRPLVLGFWSEPCTDHRSASAELGQVASPAPGICVSYRGTSLVRNRPPPRTTPYDHHRTLGIVLP